MTDRKKRMNERMSFEKIVFNFEKQYLYCVW